MNIYVLEHLCNLVCLKLFNDFFSDVKILKI